MIRIFLTALSILAFSNTPAQNAFSSKTISDYNTNFARGTNHMDFDGDGDIDILGAARGTGAFLWFENDGQGSFTDHIIYNSEGANEISAADIDGDGDLDVVGVTAGGGTRTRMLSWFENDGDFKFTSHIIFSSDPYSTYEINAMSIVDLNDDGDIDILTANAAAGSFDYYENDGNGSFTLSKISSDPIYANRASDIGYTDIDNDGDIDVIGSLFRTGKYIWFENDGNENFSPHVIEDTYDLADGAESIDAGDVDSDGDIDLVGASSSRNKFLWFENDGTQNFTTLEVEYDSQYAADANRVKLKDVDNDGDLDILGSASHSISKGLYWFENDGISNPTNRFRTNLDNSSIKTIAKGARAAGRYINMADLDGDGHEDVYGSNDETFRWYQNDGVAQNFSERYVALSLVADGASSLEGGDLDGDGDIDFVGSSFTKAIFSWFENIGNDNFQTHILDDSVIYTDGAKSVKIVDLDNDGDLDVIGAAYYARFPGNSYSGAYVWYENDGLGNFEFTLINNSNAFARSANSLTTGDFNNDGHIDIIGASSSPDNTFVLFKNDGNQNFVPELLLDPGEDFRSAKYVDSIDLDKDGDIDVLAATSGSNTFIWFENNGLNDFTTHQLDVLSSPANGAYKILGGDLDNDGDNDMVVSGGTGGKLSWYENDGNKNFQLQEIATSLNLSDFDLLDIDNDNDLDIAIGYHSEGFNLLLNIGNNTFETEIIDNSSDNSIGAGYVSHIDYNSDGLLDIIGASQYGALARFGDAFLLYQNTGINSDIDLETEVSIISGISCFGNNDASIQIDVSGGIAPYVYELLDDSNNVIISAQTSEVFAGLSADSYIVRVQDSEGQEVFGNLITLVEPPALVAQTIVSEIVCKGVNDGVIEVDVIGGTLPYHYKINDSEYVTSNVFEGLSPGNYDIEVADSNGCTITVSAIVTEPATSFVISGINHTDIDCNGTQDGSIEINVSGGTAPFQYQINNESLVDSNNFDNLIAGQYEIKAYDSAGCVLSATVVITKPEQLFLNNISVEAASCGNKNDGSLKITASGGTLPYEYSLDGVNYVSDSGFSNLSVGLYDIRVRDGNGCEAIQQVTIETESGSDFDNDGITDSCDEDSDSDGVLNVDDQCAETPPGTSVDVTGCEAFTLPVTNFTVQTVAESCSVRDNGGINITADENLEYTAILFLNGNQIDSQSFSDTTRFSVLAAGTYELCISVDEHPEYVRCFTLQITEPEPLSVVSTVNTSGKAVTLKFKGGTNYSIQLNGKEYKTTKTEITLPLENGDNAMSVKADKDCQGLYEETIFLGEGLFLYPNPITNGEFTLQFDEVSSERIQLSIYSTDGREVLTKFYDSGRKLVSMDVTKLTSGVYILKIFRGSGMRSQKIIIK